MQHCAGSWLPISPTGPLEAACHACSELLLTHKKHTQEGEGDSPLILLIPRIREGNLAEAEFWRWIRAQ
jgi:hypothetical protein